MPSTSTHILGLWLQHTKEIRLASEVLTEYEIHSLRAKALQAITNSGIRAALAKLGLELVVGPPLAVEPTPEPEVPVEESPEPPTKETQ